MTRTSSAVAFLTLAAAGFVTAQPSPSPARIVTREIHTVGGGPRKLRIDIPLLASGQRFTRVTSDADGTHAHGGLGDLRLFDAGGREVPYLLMSRPSARATWLGGAVLAIAATQKTSGFEVDLGEARAIDALTVDGLPAPFLKRFVLEGSGDRERWSMLVGQGTLLDLPEERVRQTSVAFAPGTFRYLRVTWDDTNSGRLSLPRAVRARETPTSRVPADPLIVPVTAQRQASEPGRSRYRIPLPAAGLPLAALLLEAGTGDVFRDASVMETRFSGARADPEELGRARLVRAEQRSGAPAMRIAIDAPRTSELQLVIEDGSNPPLALDRVSLEFAELPVIYFEAPGGALTARYGDPSASPPQYDLEARRASVVLADVLEASWGDPRPADTATTPAPAPPLADRGASLDVAGFRYHRAIEEQPAGLVTLQLDAAVLSHSRGPSGNFADVRLVDADSRQIPYLVERRAEPLSLDLPITPATTEVKSLRDTSGGQRSIYALTLPHPNLPNARLVFETSDRVFRRSLQVGVERPPDRRHRDEWFEVLARPSWQHADQSNVAPPLEVPIAAGEGTKLLVIVEEGDNRPLPITAVRLLLPSWRVRFFKPATPLRLVYGKTDVAAPEYDLALLAPAVLGNEAREITADAEQPPPASADPVLLSPRMFWIAIGAAVVVLLGLIVRLITSETGPPPSPPGP